MGTWGRVLVLLEWLQVVEGVLAIELLLAASLADAVEERGAGLLQNAGSLWAWKGG